MAAPKFPLGIKRGSAVVKLYRTPARVARADAARKARKQQIYGAYTIVYRFAGENRRGTGRHGPRQR